MINQHHQETIIRLLDALFPGITIYLFGSQARGTATAKSDIDIALDMGRQLTFLEIAQARNVLEALNIPEKIDIVDIQSVPAEMKEIIMREGVVWKS